MRKKIVAGNWKMNENLQEGVALARQAKLRCRHLHTIHPPGKRGSGPRPGCSGSRCRELRRQGEGCLHG